MFIKIHYAKIIKILIITFFVILSISFFSTEVSAEVIEADLTSSIEIQGLEKDFIEDGFKGNEEFSGNEITDTELDEFENYVVDTDDYSESETSGLSVVTENEDVYDEEAESSVTIQPEHSESDVLDETYSIESQITDLDILTADAEQNNEADALYNKIKRSGYVSERWNLARQFKDLYPSDSRVQEVIDFAATSMLNYGVSLHQAGNLSSAISCYDRVILEETVSRSIVDQAKKYKELAKAGTILESPTNLYNKIKRSGYVSERWNLAQQFKDLYPSDSRVQEVIDFAATSMLNYGVSLHQAGKYDQAVNCYNIILSENSIASKTRVDVEKYKTFALNNEKIVKVIYLDPGHGGSDPGANYYGIREADLNLKVSHMVKDGLVKLGYKVLMSRTSDTYIDYLDRAIDANAKNPDLFVSIHHNAAPNWPNATGIETYYYQYHPNWPPKINQEMHNDPSRIQKSASLATDIQNALINATGAVNRGVQRNTFLVLRETKMPAALIELGFMSNYSELQKLLNRSYQRVLANAIVKGIHNQFIE